MTSMLSFCSWFPENFPWCKSNGKTVGLILWHLQKNHLRMSATKYDIWMWYWNIQAQLIRRCIFNKISEKNSSFILNSWNRDLRLTISITLMLRSLISKWIQFWLFSNLFSGGVLIIHRIRMINHFIWRYFSHFYCKF